MTVIWNIKISRLSFIICQLESQVWYVLTMTLSLSFCVRITTHRREGKKSFSLTRWRNENFLLNFFRIQVGDKWVPRYTMRIATSEIWWQATIYSLDCINNYSITQFIYCMLWPLPIHNTHPLIHSHVWVVHHTFIQMKYKI